jgi:hypothetical protein
MILRAAARCTVTAANRHMACVATWDGGCGRAELPKDGQRRGRGARVAVRVPSAGPELGADRTPAVYPNGA